MKNLRTFVLFYFILFFGFFTNANAKIVLENIIEAINFGTLGENFLIALDHALDEKKDKTLINFNHFPRELLPLHKDMNKLMNYTFEGIDGLDLSNQPCSLSLEYPYLDISKKTHGFKFRVNFNNFDSSHINLNIITGSLPDRIGTILISHSRVLEKPYPDFIDIGIQEKKIKDSDGVTTYNELFPIQNNNEAYLFGSTDLQVEGEDENDFYEEAILILDLLSLRPLKFIFASYDKGLYQRKICRFHNE